VRSALAWYLQRITGALLVVLLVAHFWVEHFMTAPLRRGELTYARVMERLANPYWQAIDIAFLIVALHHGLSGARSILLDFGRLGPRAARAATILLVVAGVLGAWWGIDAFRNL
jgi:succinate dehydrogenase cytochrome b556 subunit